MQSFIPTSRQSDLDLRQGLKEERGYAEQKEGQRDAIARLNILSKQLLISALIGTVMANNQPLQVYRQLG